MPDISGQFQLAARTPESLDVPPETIAQWQNVVDRLRDQTGARSSLIRVRRGDHLAVLASGAGVDTPYHPREDVPLNARPYCAATLAHPAGYCVGNGARDLCWENGFDLTRGMVSYLGRPLVWPNGEIFGTICILHDQELTPARQHDELLRQATRAIERDLRAIQEGQRSRPGADGLASSRLPATAFGGISWQHEHEFARLATVVEQTTDAIVITGTDGTIEYVNPAFERINGYTREEVIGQNPRVLKSHRNDPAVYENLWDTISRGAVWKGNLLNKRKDGTHYHVEATIFPVHARDGRIVNYAEVMRDVTQEIELEARLRQTEKMEALGHLAGGVAHDFNNVLTAILGNIGLLRMRAERQPVSRELIAAGLEQAERTARQGAALTRQLLNFNRPQAIKLEPLNARQILSDAQRMLRRLIPTNIRFELRVDSDVYAIQGDAGQFEQILMNLVVNACDAMPTGGQLDVLLTNAELDELYVSSHVDACIGPHLLLTVRDIGGGMSTEVLNRMYEPFFTTKPPGKGTGLGLATVYTIVRRFGGHITVQSAPGEGAEFKVYFPALGECVEEKPASVATEIVMSGDETILVCEDDEVIRNLECEILEDHGYSVLPAADGRQGLDLARGCLDRIDLVVTDVVMPELDGPTLANELVALRPDLRVLFVSGYAKDAVAQLGAPNDHEHFLPKPFTSRGFLKHIRAVLDQT